MLVAIVMTGGCHWARSEAIQCWAPVPDWFVAPLPAMTFFAIVALRGRLQ
jgi:hypothetical protein